jgi:phosphatidylserine decarboxylase
MKTLLFQESRFLVLNLTLFFLILLFFNFKKKYLVYYFLILLFLIYFYRDPTINIAYNNNYIYAMSYGNITSIKETKNNYIISCFLSPTDVHIQYVPYTSKVTSIKYNLGNNYPAFISKSSKNEHLDTKFLNKIQVRQIGGILVRRIVSFLKVNEEVKVGQKLGMIKFGSRVEITFRKKNTELLIKKGDYLIGGVTRIARISKLK